jgi:hypothetical protein
MKLLTVAATLSFAIAASHIADAMTGAPAVLAGRLLAGVELPILPNLLLGVLFGTWGLYALAAAQRINPLPLTSPVIYGISGLYLFRGLFIIPQLLGHNIFSLSIEVTRHDLLISGVALLIGVIQLEALEHRKPARKMRRLRLHAPLKNGASPAHTKLIQ